MKAKQTIIAMLGAALLLTLGDSARANPTPISGVISFSGTATMDSTSFMTATKFTHFVDVFVGAPSALTGDYTGTSGASVTMTPFTWKPPGASTPVTPLWTFTSGGDTYSFDLKFVHKDFASATGLLLSGVGTAFITGPGTDKLATTGLWNLSAQTLGVSTFTFSSTTTVEQSQVPDGGSTAIMTGSGILAVGFFRRRLLAAC